MKAVCDKVAYYYYPLSFERAILTSVGECYESIRCYDEALRCYLDYISHFGEEDDVLYAVARCYYRLGDSHKALGFLTNINPSSFAKEPSYNALIRLCKKDKEAQSTKK